MDLYDLNKSYPSKRGDVFHSLQIFVCRVCDSMTNRVIIGGYPGYGVRVKCPNSEKEWHNELKKKIAWLDKPHPKKYREELGAEICELRARYKNDIENDIKGRPDFLQKRYI